MGFFDRFIPSVLNQQPHINEVWILPSTFCDGENEQTSLLDPVKPVRVYHVNNVPVGHQWTADRNAYPHISNQNHYNELTACYPDAFYTARQLSWYGDDISAETLAHDWNENAKTRVGHWEGSTYRYSAAEVEEEVDKWISRE